MLPGALLRFALSCPLAEGEGGKKKTGAQHVKEENWSLRHSTYETLIPHNEPQWKQYPFAFVRRRGQEEEWNYEPLERRDKKKEEKDKKKKERRRSFIFWVYKKDPRQDTTKHIAKTRYWSVPVFACLFASWSSKKKRYKLYAFKRRSFAENKKGHKTPCWHRRNKRESKEDRVKMASGQAMKQDKQPRKKKEF